MTEPDTAASDDDPREGFPVVSEWAELITAATVEPHDPDCDGSNVLRLTMSDGSVYVIVGGYGGYTGASCDEYVELLTIELAVAANV